MNYAESINNDVLTELYRALGSQDRRFGEWLTTVAYRWVQRQHIDNLQHLTQQNGTAPIDLMGLGYQLLLTPRDLATTHGYAARTFGVLDLYALPERYREYYTLGGILFQWLENSFVEHRQQLEHLRDAFVALYNERSSWTRISVPQAQQAAKEWVEAINRRLEAEGGTTEVVWTHQHPRPLSIQQQVEVIENHGLQEPQPLDIWEMHLLKDRFAYAAEGKTLHHCVSSYWGKKCKIYSLRCNGERRATLEINDDTLSYSGGKTVCTQIRGPHNKTPAQIALDIAHLWLDQNDIRKPSSSVFATQLENARIVNGNIAHAFHNGQGLTNITGAMSVQGERMFDFITELNVSPSFDGRGPEITLRGTPSPEGLRILQQIWRR
jgi:hypothetical protein